MAKKSTVDHREKSLIKVEAFAKLKGVSPQGVRYQIEKGNIHPVYIGMDKHVFIDWDVYRSFEFDKTKNRR